MAKKKFLSFAAAFVAAAQALTFVTATGVAEQAIPKADYGYISVEATEDLPDNDVLLGMYLEKMFYGGGISLYADYGKTQLTGTTLALYNFLKTEIEKIAAGKEISTAFTYEPATPYSDPKQFSADFSAAFKYIMVDMPAELYWYDKTTGSSFGYSSKTMGSTTTYVYTVTLAVSSEYASGKTVTINYSDGSSKTVYAETDSTKIDNAKEAVANARDIANDCTGLSDYEKLVKFNEEICALTSYNKVAADNANTPYGNPWQLVWVFDGDDSTNVVCEGYSKAFQYLCDLTGVECYTVTGVMAGGTGAGRHMWNIVVMDDGKSYLVDITNCDSGTIGDPDKLLLKGASTSTANGCAFSNLGDLTYTYDSDIIYDAGLLKVSTKDYDPANAHTHTLGKWEASADGKNHIQKCTDCGETVKTEAHKAGADYESDDTDHWQLCSVCDAEMNKTVHDFGDWNSDKDGHWKVCTVCEAKGETAAHKSSGAATEETAETCTDCGYEITPVLDHIHEWDTKWSTSDTQHWHECTKCDTGKNDLADHDWGEGVVTTETTCTEDGVKTFTCECGKTKTEAIKATGHTYDDGKVTTEATCTEDGVKTFTCTKCGDTKTEAIKATGHTYDDGKVTTEATCTEDGVKTITCTKCGDTKTEAIKSTGHTYDDGNVTKEATCAEEGEKTYTCTKCGDTKTEAIAKIPHTFDKDKWEIDGDNHKNTCTVCNTEITEPHKFGSGVTTTEPTCTDEGEMTYTCVCGKTKTSTVDALGHEPGEAVRENEVAATADKEGSYDSVIRCTRCDEIIESNTVVIPKLTPADETPVIKGEDGKSGWEVIDSEIKSAKDKDVITVDMNKATVVPKNIFEEVRGKDITVSFELDNDLVWSVNGKTVDDGALADIDFSVKTGSDFIPASVTGTITDEKPFTQLSLAHDGAFGFTAVLSVDCGKSNAELFASLYYYNGGKLNKIGNEKIGTDGIVKLTFKHASDYLITIHKEKTANEPANTQTPSEPNNSDTNPSANPNTGIKTDSVIWIAALSCLVLTAPIFKRSKKSGK